MYRQRNSFVRDTLGLFDEKYKQHHRAASIPLLNGYIDGTCKQAFTATKIQEKLNAHPYSTHFTPILAEIYISFCGKVQKEVKSKTHIQPKINQSTAKAPEPPYNTCL